MKKLFPIVFILFIIIIFFRQSLFNGLLPIPSDTIVGLYHPFRDLYAKDFPRGIPFKNFLITDPVRQQYPWRYLAINIEKNFELPLWNPYNLAGTPLLANHQSATFYPLNLFFFLSPFNFSWSVLIALQPLLAGIFIFFYLANFKLNKWASILGAISFSFSGFFIAWMEWGTVLHSALWLPLILLSINKIVSSIKYPIFAKASAGKQVVSIKDKNLLIWSLIFVFSVTASFFAGHLQIFFYLFIFSFVYLFIRWWQNGKKIKTIFLFSIFYILYFILTSVQWIPLLQFILLSARNVDQIPWNSPGWFIPWQNLIQFIAPDFFGNPTTLNYWGIWNYAEFVGYVGIVPIIFALFSLFFRHDKKTFLFGTVFFLSLIFSLPTYFAKIPYLLNIPFINTAQPTRLLFLTDFSLAILAAFGFDYFLKVKSKKEIFYPLGFIGCAIILLYGFTLYGNKIDKNIILDNLSVARHNLILTISIFSIFILLVLLYIIFYKKNRKVIFAFSILVLALTMFDLIRFGWKFIPFTKEQYLFPNSKILSFLQKQNSVFRLMSTDSRILPPNFSVMYKIQTVDGYDPLYLRRYAELIAASERGESNIAPPFGFNRIITPQNYSSKIMDLLGVKYILSLTDLKSDKLIKILDEGETRLYENKNVLSRVFFVSKIKSTGSKNEAIKEMFKKDFNMANTAVVEDYRDSKAFNPNGNADIVKYSENKVIIRTENNDRAFLILTDSYYPTWNVRIDGVSSKIYLTDFNFRGVIVPEGKHEVVFYNSLL